MKIEVSSGEIFDKLSIVNIKLRHATNPEDRAVIKLERDALASAVLLISVQIEDSEVAAEVDRQYDNLMLVNEQLWSIEDRLRERERDSKFDAEFIELARSVYITNDLRARIKRTLNQLTKSNFSEVKIYA